jgi:2-polyprenyl-3-methyl-5-hydroxy-6-metoxy-1,4-benzoquinol methylase
MENLDYLEVNKKTWNEKVEHHVGSDFYDVDSFLNGKNSLNDIECSLLGDVTGKSILHLQCHFGQDSLSLQRMGASVTGVDFSEEAIKNAIEFNHKMALDAKFICSDIYSLEQKHENKYDIIFTSYCTIGWLPDIDKWASVVRHFLKDDGMFVMADFHPVVWMYDNDFTHVQYPYFKSEAIVEEESGTYADKEAGLNTSSITWNHGLAEIFAAFKKAGLYVDEFREHDYSPYNCFNGMEEYEKGKYRIKVFGNKIPMVYSLKVMCK